MARRLTILLTGTVFLLVVELALRRNAGTLSEYKLEDVTDKFARLAVADPSPEILLLGSSRTNLGLSPEVFERETGASTFNLGISASTLPAWKLIARRALSQVNPDLIVVGINARMLRSDVLPIMSACQLFEFEDLVSHCWRYEWSNELIDYFLSYQVLSGLALWRDSDQFRMWLNESVLCDVFPKHAQLARERRELQRRELPSDGFDHPWRLSESRRTLPDLIEAWGGDYLRPPPIPRFCANDESVHVLNDLLSELRTANQQVILCYLPNSPRTEKVWCAWEPNLIDFIAAIAQSNGVPFLDASVDALPRSDADFVDDTHVALPLAERISRRVARHVVQLGLIETHGPQLVENIPNGALDE